MTRSRESRGLLALGVWSILLFAPLKGWLLAEGGTRQTLPSNRGNVRHGVVLDVDSRWVESNGMRPVRLRVRTSNKLPSPAARRFRVELEPNANYGEPRRTFVGYVELPQNALMGEATLPVLQTSEMDYISVRMYERGANLREFSEAIHSSSIDRRKYTEVLPSMLFIDRRAPVRDRRQVLLGGPVGSSYLKSIDGLSDPRAFLEVIPQNGFHRVGSGNETIEATLRPFSAAAKGKPELLKKLTVDGILRSMKDAPRADLLPPQELPETWELFSCFDIVFLSIDDLDAMARQYPKRLQSLRQWIGTGATMCVYDVGEKWERLDELNALLRPRSPDGVQASVDANGEPWSTPDVYKSAVLFDEFATLGRRRGAVLKVQPPSRIPAKFLKRRRLGLGRVIAITHQDPFSLRYRQRAAIINAVGDRNWGWSRRYGMAYSKENDSFWRHMIPGLGLPPVNMFVLSMTVFVIVLGPVNYLLLRRWKRLYLMLAIIPTAAVFVILSMLGFAILTDGFGVRVQTRSVTYLEQDSNRAYSISHQTYYASTLPSDGLVFPRDALVFPLQYSSFRRNNQGRLAARREWGVSQKLKAGNLRPRTMVQFVVSHTGQSRLKLAVDDSGPAPKARNDLQSPIELLLVRDRKGTLFVARDVGEGREADMKVADQAVLDELTELHRERLPEYPEGFDPHIYRSFNRIYRYSGSADDRYPNPDYRQGVLERTIKGGLCEPGTFLQPGEFAALIESSEAVPVGVTSPRREPGLNIVIGRW